MIGDREPEFEHEFLRGAEKMAGLDIGWREAVEDRLLRMERTKGRDSYRRLSLRRLLSEIDEEALDLGGWPVLTALVTYDSGIDEDAAHEARMLLQAIAAHGVRVSALVERLREVLT